AVARASERKAGRVVPPGSPSADAIDSGATGLCTWLQIASPTGGAVQLRRTAERCAIAMLSPAAFVPVPFPGRAGAALPCPPAEHCAIQHTPDRPPLLTWCSGRRKT